MAIQQRIRGARGAVLIHVAIALIAMFALSALAIDLGVSYVGRGQAQSAADAAALAAAISRSFVAPGDTTLAQNSALLAARANRIWGTEPDILDTDVTFPACPAGAPGVAGTCVQAEVFRTTYGRVNGNPLPTFFSRFVGINEQGTKARAVAQMLAGNATADCVKPWALADRWTEVHAPADEFNRYDTQGQNAGTLLTNPDTYDSSNGWQLPRDYGMRVQLYENDPQGTISPGFFQPVRLDGQGGHDYEYNIANCNTTPIGPGTVLQPEPGRMVGPTSHGFEDLIDQDPTATWDTTLNRPVGGCMAAGTCTRSPRWVAVPVFDIDQYMQDWIAGGGGTTVPVNIVRVVGLWLDEARNNNNIYGYITHYPTVNITGPGNITGGGAFAMTVILVR